MPAGAHALARRYAHDPRFEFGTWKIEVLGGYTSAVSLLGVAAYMGYESISRLLEPEPIRFDEAIPVAILGIIVNVDSAWLLSTGAHDHSHDHGHGHGHGHDHGHHDHHHDLNLRSAYLHVLADAATSVLAIVALLGGRYYGATWLGPVIGTAGTVLVGCWALGLLRDLHVWRVGKGKYACILGVAAHADVTVDDVRSRLTVHEELVRVTVELEPTR